MNDWSNASRNAYNNTIENARKSKKITNNFETYIMDKTQASAVYTWIKKIKNDFFSVLFLGKK